MFDLQWGSISYLAEIQFNTHVCFVLQTRALRLCLPAVRYLSRGYIKRTSRRWDTFSCYIEALVTWDTKTGLIRLASGFVRFYMMTSPNGNILRVTGHLCGNSPVTGYFLEQRPVTRSFDVFFDLNKLLSKQSRGWWFETPSCPLWRHCYAIHRKHLRLAPIFTCQGLQYYE